MRSEAARPVTVEEGSVPNAGASAVREVVPEQAASERPGLAEPESVPLVEGMAPLWSDEVEESAFRAEARDRGEGVTTAASPPADEPEPGDAKSLPPLDDLVKRIPPEVREALEDLFRARFVKVARVPAKALKG